MTAQGINSVHKSGHPPAGRQRVAAVDIDLVAAEATRDAWDEANYITRVCVPIDGGKSCAGR